MHRPHLLFVLNVFLYVFFVHVYVYLVLHVPVLFYLSIMLYLQFHLFSKSVEKRVQYNTMYSYLTSFEQLENYMYIFLKSLFIIIKRAQFMRNNLCFNEGPKINGVAEDAKMKSG